MKKETVVELLLIAILAMTVALVMALAKIDAANLERSFLLAQQKANRIACGFSASLALLDRREEAELHKKDSDKQPGGSGCSHQPTGFLCQTNHSKRKLSQQDNIG